MKWTENDLYSQNKSGTEFTYKKQDEGMMFSITFCTETKTVDISMSEFIRNDTPMFEPMDMDYQNRHSASHRDLQSNPVSVKYGHWIMVYPTLSTDDIEFIYRKTQTLFGGIK